MIAKFMKRLAVAVVASHVAIISALHVYRKSKESPSTAMFKKRSEEEKLLSWMTDFNGVPLIKDVAENTKKLNATFQVRDNDIYIVSYPKSGTTWLSEIVYNMVHNLDFIKARSLPLDERVPYLEWVYTDSRQLDAMSHDHPRVLKSHLPMSLIPPQVTSHKCKMIYIMRNPRDVSVSYYHFTKMIQPVGYNGSFEDFFKLFQTGQVAYGDWADHVNAHWKFSSLDNVLFLTYEQLSKAPVDTLNRIAVFLNKPLSNDNLRILSHYCSFNKMRKNEATNYNWLEDSEFKLKGVPFLRKGIVGDWKTHLTPKMVVGLDNLVDSMDTELRSLIDYGLDS